jgi:hypothetical protein
LYKEVKQEKKTEFVCMASFKQRDLSKIVKLHQENLTATPLHDWKLGYTQQSVSPHRWAPLGEQRFEFLVP